VQVKEKVIGILLKGPDRYMVPLFKQSPYSVTMAALSFVYYFSSGLVVKHYLPTKILQNLYQLN